MRPYKYNPCPKGFILSNGVCVPDESQQRPPPTMPAPAPPTPVPPTPVPPTPVTPVTPPTPVTPIPPPPTPPTPPPSPPSPPSKQTIFVGPISKEQLIEIASGAGILISATVASQLLDGTATSNILNVVSTEVGTEIEMTPLIGRNGEVLFQDLEEGEEGFFEGSEVAGESGIELSELSESIASSAEEAGAVTEGEGMSIFSASAQAETDALIGETTAGEGVLETDALLEGGEIIAGGAEAGAGALALPALFAVGSAVAIYDLVQPDSKIYQLFGGKAPLDPSKDASIASSETAGGVQGGARDPYDMAHKDPKGSYYLGQQERDLYYNQLVASLNDGSTRSDDEVTDILEQANTIKNGGDVYVYQNPDTGDIQTYQIPTGAERNALNEQLQNNPNYFVDNNIPPIVVYNMGYNEALAYTDKDKQYLRGTAYGYAYGDDRTNADIVNDNNADLPRDQYQYRGLAPATPNTFTEAGNIYTAEPDPEPEPDPDPTPVGGVTPMEPTTVQVTDNGATDVDNFL